MQNPRVDKQLKVTGDVSWSSDNNRSFQMPQSEPSWPFQNAAEGIYEAAVKISMDPARKESFELAFGRGIVTSSGEFGKL